MDYCVLYNGIVNYVSPYMSYNVDPGASHETGHFLHENYWAPFVQGVVPSNSGDIGDDDKYSYGPTHHNISGYEDELSEDLRDYLRRRGIKIFTNKKFKSI